MVVTEPVFTVCGTPTYVAPEILAETGELLNCKTWVYSLVPVALRGWNNLNSIWDGSVTKMFFLKGTNINSLSFNYRLHWGIIASMCSLKPSS